jgi:hypothetical protein
MSDLVILGLLIQLVALVLLFNRLGRTWYSHLGAIFILMAVLYHGISEIFISLFSSQDAYRSLFEAKYVGQFVVLISVAILVFTIAYVWAIGSRPGPVLVAGTPDAALTKQVFDYRLMFLITAPLLILTLGGQGFDSGGGLAGGVSVGTTVGLTEQFFVLGIVLSGFGFVMRFGDRWIVPVLVVQSLILALLAERLLILTGALMLIYALSRMGTRLKRNHVVVGLVLLALFGWAITAARGAEGRYAQSSGASVRLSFITTGMSHLFAASTGEEIAYTLGYRVDGDSYGAMSLQALDNGSSPVGLTPLKNDLLLAIPSFLDPSKDLSNIENRSDKLYVEENLPIPELQTSSGIYLDILPTQLGGLTPMLGPIGLIFAALALGLGFAVLDRWLRRGDGPARMLISLGVLYSVLDYEGSWDSYTTTARGILLLVALLVPVFLIKRAAQSAYARPSSSDHRTISLPTGAEQSRRDESRGSW